MTLQGRMEMKLRLGGRVVKKLLSQQHTNVKIMDISHIHHTAHTTLRPNFPPLKVRKKKKKNHALLNSVNHKSPFWVWGMNFMSVVVKMSNTL